MLDNFFDSLAKKSLSTQTQDPFDPKFLEEIEEDLEDRVDDKRFTHTLGVVEMAIKLAEIYDVDVNKARLAALLHDWDKCYNDEGMRLRIREVGLENDVDPYVYENMPKVLHGKTAAYAFGIAYPSIPTDVLNAVACHTTAAEHMAGLEMVIYVADALEPGRKYEEKDKLLTMVGKSTLHELFLEVYKYSTIAVIRAGKTLHPDTAKIWNAHLAK